jgi:hypothetical protein
MAKLKKPKPGRPKVKDRKGSHTVSLRESEAKSLTKIYGSLTKAIKSLISNA